VRAALESEKGKKMNKIILSVDIDGRRAFESAEKICSDRFIEGGLPKALSLFEHIKIKPTFFVVGKNALDFPEEHRLLRKYDVGNHSFSHINFSSLSYSEKNSEIVGGEDAIRKIIRKNSKVFRAPDYAIDYETISLLKNRGYKSDSSLLRVVFPPKYLLNYIKNRNLMADSFEIPLTSTAIPFNGTAMINYGLEKSEKILLNLAKHGIININFHDRDFTNEKIPSPLFRNRENAFKITKGIIEFISNHFEVIDFNTFFLKRRRL
jgi:peptidoglycan/xylan/chitin deacetylase (PgdA/CDA1 family)